MSTSSSYCYAKSCNPISSECATLFNYTCITINITFWWHDVGLGFKRLPKTGNDEEYYEERERERDVGTTMDPTLGNI